jgi:hypothetical protein
MNRESPVAVLTHPLTTRDEPHRASLFVRPTTPWPPAAIAHDDAPAPAMPESVTTGPLTKVVAVVLGTICLTLLGAAEAGIAVPHAVHQGLFVVLLAYLGTYPAFRLTRWIVSWMVDLESQRWAVWNVVWTLGLLWTIFGAPHG